MYNKLYFTHPDTGQQIECAGVEEVNAYIFNTKDYNIDDINLPAILNIEGELEIPSESMKRIGLMFTEASIKERWTANYLKWLLWEFKNKKAEDK